MSVSPLDMTQTQSKMQAQGVELQQRTLGNLNGSNLSDAEKSEKLREACEGFESIFIQKMWQQMRATVPQENPLVGREEKFWQSMYDQELSKKMASSGGIGLAEMMYEQLSRNLVSASSNAASAVSRTAGTNSGFDIDAVPLMPRQEIPPMATSHQGAEQGEKNSTSVGNSVASIYDGAAPQVGDEGAGHTGTTQAHAFTTNQPANQQPYPQGGVTPVQQVMQGLQQKQAAHAGMNAYATNGVAQAQNVEFQVSSQGGGGVVPQTPHVVRTTYTTNMPQNADKRGETVHREVVRNLHAGQAPTQAPTQVPGQLAGQVASANNMYNGNAPVLTAPPTTGVPAGAMPMGTMPTGAVPTGTMPTGTVQAGAVQAGAVQAGTVQTGSVPAAATPAAPTHSVTPINSVTMTQQAPVTQTAPPATAANPQANAIRPILPAGAVVAPSMSPNSVSIYDPVRPYAPTGTQRKVEGNSDA